MSFTVSTGNSVLSPLCETYVSGDLEDSNSSSSSRGLSGGAIAGIVIACIAVVAVVGLIFVFVSKGAALFGGVKSGAAASYSQAGTSSVTKVSIDKN